MSIEYQFLVITFSGCIQFFSSFNANMHAALDKEICMINYFRIILLHHMLVISPSLTHRALHFYTPACCLAVTCLILVEIRTLLWFQLGQNHYWYSYHFGAWAIVRWFSHFQQLSFLTNTGLMVGTIYQKLIQSTAGMI